MSSSLFEDKTDLARIIIKPLYFGLLVNIVIPMGLLLVFFYINNNHYIENRVGDFANPLFYIFIVLALLEAALALWWRGKLFKQPMIRRPETFENDFSSELLARSKPIFILIASISVYGYVYLMLTGRFTEGVLFVVFSFVVFQVVRPRYGMTRKLIERQQQLVKEGKFRTG